LAPSQVILGDSGSLTEARQNRPIDVGNAQADERCGEEDREQKAQGVDPCEYRQQSGEVIKSRVDCERYACFECGLRKPYEATGERQKHYRYDLTHHVNDAARLPHARLLNAIDEGMGMRGAMTRHGKRAGPAL
jgi:hypothetical protein